MQEGDEMGYIARLVIGFPVKVSDIAEQIQVPTCGHTNPSNSKFCGECGRLIGFNLVWVLKGSKMKIAPYELEGVTIADVPLFSLKRHYDDNTKGLDNLYFCGVELANVSDYEEATGDIEDAAIKQAVARVRVAHAQMQITRPIVMKLIGYETEG